MKRAGRLQSAKKWLKEYTGKNILRGYRKHYGVDWRCAVIELQQLGVHFDPEYLKQREVTEQQTALARKRRREVQAREHEESSESWYDYETPQEAYLAEDYAALYDMQCKENGWDPLSPGPEDLYGVWIGEDPIDEIDSLSDDIIWF